MFHSELLKTWMMRESTTGNKRSILKHSIEQNDESLTFL